MSTNTKVDVPAIETYIDLDITGMTCAACASRIERKLNKIDGVQASVNYATERARVRSVNPLSADEVITVVEQTGYGARRRDDSADDAGRLDDLRRRLVVAIVLGVPVLLMSMIPALQFDGWQWVSLALATPVATWCAYPFHRSAWLNALHGQATMDTLVSIGVIAAYLWSLWALIFTPAGHVGMKMAMSLSVRGETGGYHIYLEVASTVVAFILAGRYFEARSKRRAGAAIRALLELGASSVSIVDEAGNEQLVAIDQLKAGDVFIARPGEKIATDGEVVDGRSAVDQALVTGESVPIEVGPGDTVIGASVNQHGRLTIRAVRVGADTQLAQMARLVEEAQSGKAPVQRLADRISGVFVPIVILLSLLTLFGWLIVTGDAQRSFAAAVAVLIIACPCALGLATPTALLVGTGRGAQMGIIIRGPEVLESTRQIDTIVLDKTGTVTTGQMALVDVIPAAGIDRAELLKIAGGIDAASEHPIARAITAAARDQLGSLPPVVDFANSAGVGVIGTIEGNPYTVGRPTVDRVEAGDIPDAAASIVEVRRADGGRELIGTLLVADRVKPTSPQAIAELKELGLSPVLLTGDRLAVGNVVARDVGIETVYADVLPADKVAVVRNLQGEGKTVAMVGDGVNDAAALAQADLGIAMGSGTDVAIEVSDLTLVRSDLRSASDAIRLSRRTLATIKGNLFWAFAYNVLAIPLAMSGRLSPAIAGAAMAFSSVFVVSNSLRLRRFR